MAKRTQSLNGGEAHLREFMVNNNQTIVKGDLLLLSGGKVSKSGAAASAIVGLAMADITTVNATTADIIPVLIIDEFTVLEFPFTGVFTDALMYMDAYDMTAAQVVDQTDTVGGILIPVAFDQSADAAGTVWGVIAADKLWNAVA